MLDRVRPRITYANVIATLALFIALGGGAYATTLGKNSVGTKQLEPGAVRGSDLAKNAVSSPKVRNGSLLSEDFAPNQLPRGPQGPPGSPDTPDQVLEKLLQVDGSGSGLDAELLAGQSAGEFAPANELHSSGRVTFKDETPGDLTYQSAILLTNSDETFFLAGVCGDNLAGGGADAAWVALINEKEEEGWSYSVMRSDGTHETQPDSPAGSALILKADSPPPGGTDKLLAGTVIAVASNGATLSADISAEVNDTASGGACTFAATGIG